MLIEETDLSTIKKMSGAEFDAWHTNYYRNRHAGAAYEHLRYGQAFINDNYPGIICPRLFHEENLFVATTMIQQYFVDWSAS